MSLIKSINWIVTYKCNCRCNHCDIWKLNSDLSFKLSDIKKVLDDPFVIKSYNHYGSNFDISLGGGEPFLLDNLEEIVCTIEDKLPGSFKCITTSGLPQEKIIKFIKNKKNLDFKINLSLDGLSNVHNSIRGRQDSFEKVLKALLMIRKVNPRQKIGVKMTLIPLNFNQIVGIYRISKKLNCDFVFKPAENIKNYTNKFTKLDLTFDKEKLCVIRDQAFYLADEAYKQRSYQKSKFFKDIPFYLYSQKKPEKCSVLENDLTIMPDGKIYDCLMQSSLGNLKKQDLHDLWENKIQNRKKCPSCMLMCGSYKDYNNNFYRKKVANVETTSKCNLDCEMCTQKELRMEKRSDMTISIFKKMLKKYPDISHVSFVGGESFMNKDFFRMMRTLDKRGITYEITTNGTLVNKEVAEKLKNCAGLKKINFSLDGSKGVHDKVRGKGVFEKCIKAIKLTKDYFNVNVCTVIRGDNLQDIPKLSKHLIDLGVKTQKIIFGMNLDSVALQNSKKKIPSLKIQGPHFLKNIKSIEKLKGLFKKLVSVSKTRKIIIDFEPEIMRKNPELFFKKVSSKNGLSCKQLAQYRFNLKGKRIVCEFIRNLYDPILVKKLEESLLLICQKCCKLQQLN